MRLKTAMLATVAFLPAMALAEEQRVEIAHGEGTIVGILNIPDGQEDAPVVLMLHGFTGQKNEFTVAGTETGLYSFLAEQLAGAGIASLRIDFTGSGESSGDWSKTTFSSQIDDAVVAFDHLQTRHDVDGTRIGVLGYSQGGLVGAHLAALRPETDAVVLWAPVTNPLETYSMIMGRDNILRGMQLPESETLTAPLSWGGETTLAGSFFHEIPTASAAAAIAGYDGPLRVIVGAKETIVTPQPLAGQQLLKYHHGEESLVVLDSDHDFGAGTSIDMVRDELAPKTIEWFQQSF